MNWLLELGPWQAAAWWAIYTMAAAYGWLHLADQHRPQTGDRLFAWWLWHWFTGGPLVTHRSFPEMDDDRSAVARVGHRALVGVGRTVIVVVAAAIVYVAAGGQGSVIVAGPLVAAATTAWTLAVVIVAVGMAHYRQWIRPTHRAVHPLAMWDESHPWWSYLTIHRALIEGSKGILVFVSPKFDWASKHVEAIDTAVRSKLPVGDAVMTRVSEGRHGHLRWRPRDPMPGQAMFRDPIIRRLLTDATESAPLIGVTRGHTPVAVDLDSESPHVLLSASTGGGKSSVMRTITAQLMRNGADVTVFDIKRSSQRWLRPLPGARYVRDIGEMHRVLCELGAEGHARNKAWDDVDIDEQGPVFHRHVILLEEMNATMAVLKQWWKNHKDPGDPPESPAVRSLAQILFMGRHVRMHVLAIAQMATVKDLGGTEQRENYATRILARHTQNAWKMLVPECEFKPATRHPGRMWVCIGGVATETQGVFMTEHEARGFVSEVRGLVDPNERGVALVASRDTPVHLGEQPATVAMVTLKQASLDGADPVVDLRYDALRKSIERDRETGEAPLPIGKRGKADLYSPAALRAYVNNRPMAKPSAGDGSQDNEESADDFPQHHLPSTAPGHRDADRDRFWDKVDLGCDDDCHEWTAAVNADGYGVYKVDGRTVLAHRWAYEDAHGPIPEGLTIDHLCGNKPCVRDDHLEPVTNAVNLSRGHARRRAMNGASQ